MYACILLACAGIFCYLLCYYPFDLQLVISEVTDSAPMALQAVKLLAQYMGGRIGKVGTAARTCGTAQCSRTYMSQHKPAYVAAASHSRCKQR
jgi:hypothetical protein